jgi:hypothetical protein
MEANLPVLGRIWVEVRREQTRTEYIDHGKIRRGVRAWAGYSGGVQLWWGRGYRRRAAEPESQESCEPQCGFSRFLVSIQLSIWGGSWLARVKSTNSPTFRKPC